ncbi:MAG: fimbrillin family protein [Tidjanibacter sp.]|nr:fimbrillin family protein [Tidjanibacter sp.]
MKKFFALAAVVAVALTSCVTTTEIPDPAGEISFEAFNYKAQGRAVVHGPIEDADGNPETETNYPETEHFGAYAFITNDKATYTTYMDNVEIEKYEGAWRNRTKKYYWPKGTNAWLKFVSYSPFAYKDNGADATHSINANKGIDFSNFVTTADWDKQIDLMTTDLSDNLQSGVVATPFKHRLAQVCFQVSKSTEYGDRVVTLDNLTMSNVKSTGNYTSGVWTTVGDEVLTFEYLPLEATQTVTTTAAAVGTNAALVIPQDGTKSDAEDVDYVKVLIDYTIDYGGGVKDVITGTTVTIPTEWLEGKKYTYTITIGMGGEITFSPTVTDWTAGEGGNITVG